MKLSFHGAARNVTGSKHLITLENGYKILLDCGMFQGLGHETEHLNSQFGFHPEEIDVLLLSHAHIDHSGLIPKLVKEGFKGKIICTEATRELTEILLHDSALIQEHEAEYNNSKLNHGPRHQPLYDIEDVKRSMELFQIIKYEEWLNISDEAAVFFSNAGHLIGSAAIFISINENNKHTTILYSGDIGRYRSVLLQSPSKCQQADYIILESTYGDKHHDITFNTIETIQKWIKNVCLEKKGKLIIPAFSVGRTQEVLYALNQLSLEKRLPELNYFIDSPLSLKATRAVKKYTEQFNERLQKVLLIDDDPFDFPGLKYVETAEDSRKLVDHDEPCVVISSSGTADAGRVKHHINKCISDPNSAILMVGYCGPKSLGGQLLKGACEIELFGDPCPVAASIGQIQGMSAHGDYDDLCTFLSSQDREKVKTIFLVHGEYHTQQHFANKLESKGFAQIEIPGHHQEFRLSGRQKNYKAA